VVIEDLVFNSNPPPRFFRFSSSPHAQHAATLGLMPCVTVRNGNEFHFVSLGRIFCSQSPSANVAIVRMCTKCDHTNLR
jgi:hypothetical protein